LTPQGVFAQSENWGAKTMLNITVTGGLDTKRLKKAVEDSALKQVKIKVKGIRCLEHERIPRLVVKAGAVEIGDLCCEELREKVNRALQRR
jgi:hypothetical protein